MRNSIIADTIHGNVVLTPLEKKVISHVTFNRLHDVYQNSTVYLTFPCNRTKRFEHSMGTMKLCSDMFCSSILNTENDVVTRFFDSFEENLKKLINKIKINPEYSYKIGQRPKLIKEDTLPEITFDNSIYLRCPEKVGKYKVAYSILLQAVRIGALLHDIGHPPYSHITEFALSEVREKYKDDSKNERIVEFNTIMDDFFSGEKKKLHEKMGDKIVKIILSESIENISTEQANGNEDMLTIQVYELLVKETVENILNNNRPFNCLHSIIDGTLDGDRLDYVTRDALNSGINKGKIEYDRLCSGMTIVQVEDEYCFCPSIKVLNTVEDYLNRRWDIYKNIIFHHRVVKTDYLLQTVVKDLSINYLENNLDSNYDSEDTDLLPANISGLWKALKTSTNTECSYAISQWDDSWLMTILKKHYFQDYISKGNKILTKQLSELLTNKKYYFSAIKRLEDFLIIDKAIVEELCNRSEELSLRIKKTIDRDDAKDALINNIENIITMSKKIFESSSFLGLIYPYLRRSHNFKLDNKISDIVNNSKSVFESSSVEDIFSVVKKYDIGVKKPLYFYDEKQKKAVSIHEISSIPKSLSLNYDTFPQFYIYILKTQKYQDINIDIDKFLKKIGKSIAENFYTYCIEIIER